MMAFILGMLVGAAAVVLITTVYAVCQMSQIEQYRSGRVDFTGVPINLARRYFENKEWSEE